MTISAGLPSPKPVSRKQVVVDGLDTSYLDGGEGKTVVLLHGGEFGAGAELGFERILEALAARYHVLAPDMLGFGHSAKVVDFNDGRGLRIRHVAAWCRVLGIDSAHFVGNSMGAVMLLADQTSDHPLLPVRSLVAICGGGEIQQNEHMQALYDYDATMPAMRRIVEALFHDTSYSADGDFVRRRYESSTAPGAWEAVAAARFRRPDAPAQPAGAGTGRLVGDRPYERIAVPTLVVEGECDKLLPSGWAKQLADRVRDGTAAVIPQAGHCPQIEQPGAVSRLLLEFFENQCARARVTEQRK
ncbi:alpha/beta fold hydrolase [Nocardia sp. 348MFTsu5.1]|uniref:alpha/beta fold hydrolase n=1 Tax=Nocardia sp. 348MFTsu5.1 TaxID=1172185 RepID=UPI00036F99B7|nr:alpha/beta hydrolase [Nocardia sp. 348MFTsu5.1]